MHLLFLNKLEKKKTKLITFVKFYYYTIYYYCYYLYTAERQYYIYIYGGREEGRESGKRKREN